MRSNAKTASLAAQALARAAAGARAHVLHPPGVAVRGQLTLVVKAFVISVSEASGNRLAARTQVLAKGLACPVGESTNSLHSVGLLSVGGVILNSFSRGWR